MVETVRSHVESSCPWRDLIHWFDTTDSTNLQAKKFATAGAPHGTSLIAGAQTAGRGRLGRHYHSIADKGLYISLILRPNCKPEELMHLTCAVAVATVNAIEECTGYRPGIKWINDIVSNKRKLGGILTELSIDAKTGIVSSAIIGIGINCSHAHSDFPVELQEIATSLLIETGIEINRYSLAGKIIENLWRLDAILLHEQTVIMGQYRRDCITLGKGISVIRTDTVQYGKALNVNEDGSLTIQYSNGETENVLSGEVSIRGMYGYI